MPEGEVNCLISREIIVDYDIILLSRCLNKGRTTMKITIMKQLNLVLPLKITNLIRTEIEKGIKLLSKNRNTKKKDTSPVSSSGRWRRFLHICRANPGKMAFVALALFIVLALSLTDALLAGPMRPSGFRKDFYDLMSICIYLLMEITSPYIVKNP
jgi:hypothetical protein